MDDWKEKSIWIAWERHRRTENLVRELGIPLYVFESTASRWQRHPLFMWKTFWVLVTQRPRILFVQNPSVILTLMAIFLKPLFRYVLVVDAHNAGVYPFEAGHEKYNRVFPFLHRNSDLTIVTNKMLGNVVDGNSGRPFILPDAMPEFPDNKVKTTPRSNSDSFSITFICTFASDEPYLEVMRASRNIPDNIMINISGNSEKLTASEREVAGENVNFTGFLPEDEFIALLANSNFIMDLTTFNDCMVCGAYEAVSLEVPLILSDTPALRDYFHKGVIFAGNNAEGLAAAIRSAPDVENFLRLEIQDLKRELLESWAREFARLEDLLGELKC